MYKPRNVPRGPGSQISKILEAAVATGNRSSPTGKAVAGKGALSSFEKSGVASFHVPYLRYL